MPRMRVTNIRMTWSATRKNMEAMATITNTMAVVMAVSRRLGHVTFCASARTSCKNLNGLIFAIELTCRHLGVRPTTHSGLRLAGVEGLEPPTPGFGVRG